MTGCLFDRVQPRPKSFNAFRIDSTIDPFAFDGLFSPVPLQMAADRHTVHSLAMRLVPIRSPSLYRVVLAALLPLPCRLAEAISRRSSVQQPCEFFKRLHVGHPYPANHTTHPKPGPFTPSIGLCKNPAARAMHAGKNGKRSELDQVGISAGWSRPDPIEIC